METVQTSYGDVSLQTLIDAYQKKKHNAKKHAERRLAFIQTDEGKQLNRARAKKYYEEHKEEILAKRKAAKEANEANE